jgi:kynurenine formamidase
VTVAYSRVIDLGHEMYTNMPILDDNATTLFWENNTFDGMARYSEGKISARSRMMLMFEHSSTHVDAPRALRPRRPDRRRHPAHQAHRPRAPA